MRFKESGLSTAALVVITVGIIMAVVVPVTIVAVLLAGGSSFATPEDTITNFVNAFNAYDADATWNCLSSQYQSQITKDQWITSIQGAKDMNRLISGLQIESVYITDDTATATVSYTIDGYTSTGNIHLVREGGQWKLASLPHS